MASETSSLSQSSLTTKDEFEWLEVTEFDTNTLRELLYDPVEEVESGGALMQAMEVAGANPGLSVDSYWCLDDITSDEVQNFNWLDMEEEASALFNDIGAWYGGPCMEEFNENFEVRDYSLSHSAILSDEIGYIGLWQEN